VTLLKTYVAQRGLYARVAKQLGMDPSYVSRVANGKRQSKKISLAIEGELNKMYASSSKITRPFSKKPLLHPSRKSRLVTNQ
jgi:transcriptional regulator with XRE-family HTH domain